MAEKKKKPEHETIINTIDSENKKLTSYVWALKHEHDTMLSSTRDHFIKNMGADKAYEYLKTSEGQEEYSKIGDKKVQDLALNRYGIDKSKVNEFDLTRLVEGTYGMNKNTLFKIASMGPDFDFADYKSNFLNDYLKQVNNSLMQNHLMNFDTNQIPSIAKHIGLDNYLSDVNSLKDDKFKSSIAQAVINWDKGKNPLGASYLKQDPNLSSFLKDKYKSN